MTDIAALVDRYIAMWNETDAARRSRLIAETWNEGATYLDPMLQGGGHTGIEAMVAGVQAQIPGHRFRLTGAVDSHHEHLRFTWSLGPDGGPALVDGTDFGVLSADGRLEAITGFFDRAPGQG